MYLQFLYKIHTIQLFQFNSMYKVQYVRVMNYRNKVDVIFRTNLDRSVVYKLIAFIW